MRGGITGGKLFTGVQICHVDGALGNVQLRLRYVNGKFSTFNLLLRLRHANETDEIQRK